VVDEIKMLKVQLALLNDAGGDCTDVLQAIVDYASENDIEELQLASGMYLVKKPIRLHPEVKIRYI
jgi:hypothetical protein